MQASIGHNSGLELPACGECGKPCPSPKARFCCNPCRYAYHNRMKARGQSLAPLVMAACTGRRGKSDVAKWARREMCALADRWAREDREAGRIEAADLLTTKYEMGWKACDL